MSFLDKYRSISTAVNDVESSKYKPAPTRYIFAPKNVSGVDPDSVLHHAPDAMVLINQSDKIENKTGIVIEKKDINRKLLRLNCDLSMRKTPGSGSFVLQVPYNEAGYFEDGYASIPLFSEVNFYIKGRFPVKGNHDVYNRAIKDYDMLNAVYPYYHVFWGVVTSMSQDKTPEGENSITYQCADILRFWEVALINLKSGAASVISPPQGQGGLTSGANAFTIYNNKFFDQSVYKILDYLATNVMGEMIGSEGFITQVNRIKTIENENSKRTNETTPGKKTKATDKTSKEKKKERDVEVEVDADKKPLDISKGMRDYWQERFKSAGTKLRIYGYESEEKYKELEDVNKAKSTTALDGDLELFNFDVTKFPNPSESIIKKITPYAFSDLSVSLFQSDYQSKLAIANQIAETLLYEFYMDTNGELIFKPPFFNMDVRRYPPYIINDIDITSSNVVEEEQDIYTLVDVTGNFGSYTAGNKFIGARFFNTHLAQKFGIRPYKYHGEFIRSAAHAWYYANAYMALHNARVFLTSQMSIYIRPELRLGFPVYVPSKEMYFYITGIAHSVDFTARNASTTLTLEAGRRRLRGQLSKDVWGKSIITYNVNSDPLKNLFLVATSNQAITNQKYDLLDKTPVFGVENTNFFYDYVYKKNGQFKPYNDKLFLETIIQATKSTEELEFARYLLKEDEYDTLEKIHNSRHQMKLKVASKDVFDNMCAYQISDNDGYEMIGTLPYGVNEMLDEEGKIVDRTDYNPTSENLSDKNDRVRALLDMMPYNGSEYITLDNNANVLNIGFVDESDQNNPKIMAANLITMTND
ncbi:MAG: hypothetical protein WC783_00645 [Candidatus Paceibacterota bacterium]|jgi:hypothetical protein